MILLSARRTGLMLSGHRFCGIVWLECRREACEITRAYLFLMHEGYSTGQVVVVDSGGVLV
ncbi:MAG TPA: hypothetical protein VFF50_00220 [Candidatus Deferrimicrobiaceae bacterium]|nr:hypothetical protein [Candidatus Deferrimicrobiaceae bacterium]